MEAEDAVAVRTNLVDLARMSENGVELPEKFNLSCYESFKEGKLMPAEQITMYGTSWCGDCARARRLLDKHSVKFTWNDIERDMNARSFVERVNRGNRSVPTIVFPDGSILVEPSDSELEAKLKLAGLL
mgnify:CR=1 FL=1